MGIVASIVMRSEDSTHPTFGSLQTLLQPVEFLQRGEGRQVVDVEVAEFVHDGMLFRGEEGALLFALLFRGAFGDFGFARVVEVVRFGTARCLTSNVRGWPTERRDAVPSRR